METYSAPEGSVAEKYFAPTLKGAAISIAELRQRVEQSAIGQHFLTQTPRYTQSFPVPHEKAVDYYGIDACPVQHQTELADIYLMQVLDAEYDAQTLFLPNEDDIALLHFVCSIHDIGESEHQILIEAGLTPVGDIPSGQKKDEDRHNEAKNLAFLFGYFFSDLDMGFLDRAFNVITHNPSSGDEFIHEIYETAHGLQSLATAYKAGESAERVDVPEADKATMRRLKLEVSIGATAWLSERKYFDAVNTTLEQHNQSPKYICNPDASNSHLHQHDCNIAQV